MQTAQGVDTARFETSDIFAKIEAEISNTADDYRRKF